MLKFISFLSILNLLILFLLVSCNRPPEGSQAAGAHISFTVEALRETDPVPAKKNEDSADDPAIWIHPENPEKSFIIGTNKKGGLATYALTGKQLNYYGFGKMNNCDLRKGFALDGDTIDILAATNRSYQSISLFKISENGILDSVHVRTIHSEMTAEVYGLCMYKSCKTDAFHVFINSTDGEVEQWMLFNNNRKVDAKLVRSFKLASQTEGMVADDETAVLYIGEEKKGIWRFSAEPDNNSEGILIHESSEKNQNIRFDIEGLALYQSGEGKGFLVASSQGNYSYAVFERHGENNYIGSFSIISITFRKNCRKMHSTEYLFSLKIVTNT